MKRIDLLEFFFIITAIAGISGAVGFGRLCEYNCTGSSCTIGSTGYNGGAIAMGLIGAVSLLCVALIEIARFKKETP